MESTHRLTSASSTFCSTGSMEQLFDGTTVCIRPIRPEDAEREQEFLSHLSPELRAYRFLGLIKHPTANVARELACEEDDGVTLIALVNDGNSELEVGAARYRVHDDATSCDGAVTIHPEWQGRGVGMLLMQRLIDVARRHGVRRMYAADAARCAGNHLLAERLGFRSRPDPEDPTVTTFELDLGLRHAPKSDA